MWGDAEGGGGAGGGGGSNDKGPLEGGEVQGAICPVSALAHAVTHSDVRRRYRPSSRCSAA